MKRRRRRRRPKLTALQFYLLGVLLNGAKNVLVEAYPNSSKADWQKAVERITLWRSPPRIPKCEVQRPQ